MEKLGRRTVRALIDELIIDLELHAQQQERTAREMRQAAKTLAALIGDRPPEGPAVIIHFPSPHDEAA